MKERTEEQKVMMAPIKVRLGEKEYEVPVLRLGAAVKWREKYDAAMRPVTDSFVGKDLGEALRGGLSSALLEFPQVISDLVLAYCPSLPREAIFDPETGATEEQMAKAFSDIMVVAYPFMQQLGTVIRVFRTAAAASLQ